MKTDRQSSFAEMWCRRIFWAFYVFLFAAPVFWVFLVSLQPNAAASGRRFTFPSAPSLDAYTSTLFGNSRDIFSSFLFSAEISIVSTAIVMAVAMCASYVVSAGIVAAHWRRSIVTGAIGLYFLPPFAVYPGIEELASWASWIGLYSPTFLKLVVVQSIQPFPIAFFLLLATFRSMGRPHFNQLLLETGSRPKAFWLGIVKRKPSGIIAIVMITFAVVWNEFYLSAFISGRQQEKPLSVILQMFVGQHDIDYVSLAVGSIVSLVIPALVAAVCWLVVDRKLAKESVSRQLKKLRNSLEKLRNAVGKKSAPN